MYSKAELKTYPEYGLNKCRARLETLTDAMLTRIRAGLALVDFLLHPPDSGVLDPRAVAKSLQPLAKQRFGWAAAPPKDFYRGVGVAFACTPGAAAPTPL